MLENCGSWEREHRGEINSAWRVVFGELDYSESRAVSESAGSIAQVVADLVEVLLLRENDSVRLPDGSFAVNHESINLLSARALQNLAEVLAVKSPV